MIDRLRLTFVLTHPIQYYAPWARWMARYRPDVDLTVVYAAEPTPKQQGSGFGREFTWDIPMREGYRSVVARAAVPGASFDSDDLRGIDVPEIADAIAASRPDVALLTGWHSITQLRALRALRAAGVPVIYRGDSHLESAAAGARRSLSRLRARWLLRQFDRHLAVGRRSRAFLAAMGVPDPCIVDSPHAVDNDFFAATARANRLPAARSASRAAWGLGDTDVVVLFAGKFVPKKRPADVLRAVATLRDRVSVLMVGAGALERELRETAARLGVNVAWAGFLNQTEMGRAYAAADVLVLPSDWSETWGLVVNEALASGLPCIVSDRVGCGPDLVEPDRTGEVFPFADVPALAAAIDRVRARVRAGHSFSEVCQSRVARYDYRAATEGLVGAARSALAGRHGGIGEGTCRVVAPCGHLVMPGGMERMTFAALGALRQHGASVHCLLNRWDSRRIARLAERIDASWSVGYYWHPPARHPTSALQVLRIGWDILRCSRDLLAAVRSRRATHVFLPEFLSAVRHAPALAWLRLRGMPVILRVGMAPSEGRFYRWLWRAVVNPLVSRFVANSAFTAREIRGLGIGDAKISTIPNVLIETTAAHRGPSAPNPVPRVLFAGQLIPQKGVMELLEAVALLAARGVAVTLDVAGSMDEWAMPEVQAYRAALRERAARPDLAGRVRFLGWRDDVGALMAGADLHCAPSWPAIREAFGLVVLEAKAAGIPSVVCASGALPDLVEHGMNGWVCADPTPASLAEGLAYFLTSSSRRQSAGAAAHRSLQRFGREEFVQAWCSLIGLAVATTPRAAHPATVLAN